MEIFVDWSKFILKVMLLHNGNIHLSIPIAHSVHMKETYETIDLLSKTLSYLNYEWKYVETLKSWVTPRMQSG